MKLFAAPRRTLAPALALAFALVAGCTSAPGSAEVPPPESGGEWAECPPVNSQPIAVSFRVNVTSDAGAHARGLHRLDARTFLWVYANEASTLREDRVTRVNAVELARDGRGLNHLCTRVDIATPTEVDDVPGPNVVAALITAGEELPSGPLVVSVDWLAGCRCDPLPRGNMTARFEP